VLASHLLPRLESGELSRILFLSTGAMMSPDSIKQGQNIPAVAHLLEFHGAKQQNSGSQKGGSL
jgi:stage V sporulation protein AD